MNQDDCFQLGYILRTHGLVGEVQVHLDVDDPAEYDELDSVFVEQKGQLVPYFVESIAVRGNKAIVAFEDVETLEQAQALVGNALWLPLDNLPDLDEKRFYFHEIGDFTVIDAARGTLGTVITVYSLPQQDLIAMQYRGQEVLIPITDTIVTGVNREQRELYVSLPEGLLEVYLDDAAEPEGDVS